MSEIPEASLSPAQVAGPATTTQNPSIKASRQRFKPQLSCTFCRHRKLKCDRNQPCDNCRKRNQAQSCTYISPPAQKKTPSAIRKPSTATKDVGAQIRHLEALVVSLMNQSSSNGNSTNGQQVTTPDSSSESVDGVVAAVDKTNDGGIASTMDSFGRISIENKKPNYVGGDHWAAILDTIACLKDQVETTQPKILPETTSNTGPELLVGSFRPATRAEIMVSIPSQETVDALMNRFFAIPDIASCTFHEPKFMREYKSFWQDPNKTSIAWIGLLYSIMALTAYFETTGILSHGLTTSAIRDPESLITVFREKTVQCLILSNYTEPGPYTVETMLLYYVSDHFRTSDTQFGGWMVFGLVVRAAMRMGLHRDASHYPSISAFRGEMQRRLWGAIVHIDLLTSLQVGLPRMIREGIYDTKAPRNLLDEDFDEQTTVLPPSRDNIDLPISFSNAKHTLAMVAGNIVDLANSVHPPTYEQVITLDKSLHEAYGKLPEDLAVRNDEDLASGTGVMRIRKFAINLSFQKARCILHRRFFTPSSSGSGSTSGEARQKTNPYPYSTKSCLEGAMSILSSQILISTSESPSCSALSSQIYGHRWKTSSLMLHDFLLAAMLVCLYLGQEISNREMGFEGGATRERYPDTSVKVRWSKEEMRSVLERSLGIWEESQERSQEAKRAVEVLRVMLVKIGREDGSRVTSSVRGSGPSPSDPTSNSTTTPQTITTTSPNLSIPAPDTASTTNLSTMAWDPISTFPISHALNNTNNTNNNQFNNAAQPFFPSTTTAAEHLNWQLWDAQFYPSGNQYLGDPTFNSNSGSELNSIPSAELWGFDASFASTAGSMGFDGGMGMNLGGDGVDGGDMEF